MSRCMRPQAPSRLLSRFTFFQRSLFFTVVAVLALAGVGISNSSAVKQTFSAFTGNSEPAAAATKPRAGAIAVHAAGRGKPFLNLQDGREMSVEYRGDQKAAAALQNGAAQARSLASADFDGNGTWDLLAGYAFNGAGMITSSPRQPGCVCSGGRFGLCADATGL